MGRIYRRVKGGNWYGEWRDRSGRRHQRSLRTKDKAVARKRLREWELGEADRCADQGPTLGKALEYMVETDSANLAEGTRHCYRQKAMHLCRLLHQDTPLAALTKEMVQQYIAVRREEGAHPNSINKELVTLRKTLRVHERDTSVVPKTKTGYTPRTRFLTRSEFDLLVEALPEKRRLFVVLAVYTGANLGELHRLGWEHVDLESGWIRIPGTKRASRWRRVPISDELRPWLEEADENRAGNRHAAHIARHGGQEARQDLDVNVVEGGQGESGEVGGRLTLLPAWPNSQRDLAAACRRAGPCPCGRTPGEACTRRACKRPGIPPVTSNDLRRTFASWLVQAGVPTRTVADLMGHTSTRMVDKVYGQLTEKEYREAVSSLGCNVGDTPSVPIMSVDDLARRVAEHLRKEESPGKTEASEVPRDRVELPTRGFSVLWPAVPGWSYPPKIVGPANDEE